MKPTWQQTFMQVAQIFADRATCHSLKVGCVIVSEDNRIIAQGYNGDVAGAPDCQGESCLVNGRCGGVTIHAEQNALYYAAKRGISVLGSTAYVTTVPCAMCMKGLAQSGIVKVVYRDDYRDMTGIDIARKYGIQIIKMSTDDDHQPSQNS
jgi:dCMP deaminase